jgi:hypothetical protein
VRQNPNRSTAKTFYCQEGPAHEYNLKDYWERGHPKKDKSLTIVKGYGLPREQRFESDVDPLDCGPGPTAYENTNEIMNRHIMRNPGSFK